MTRFAPAFTAFCSTSSVAMEVVTTPVTTVDGSPALNVSTSSLLHSTPMFFLIRSTISCAVIAAAPPSPSGPRRTSASSLFTVSGRAMAPAAASDTNSRREMNVMSPLSSTSWLPLSTGRPTPSVEEAETDPGLEIKPRRQAQLTRIHDRVVGARRRARLCFVIDAGERQAGVEHGEFDLVEQVIRLELQPHALAARSLDREPSLDGHVPHADRRVAQQADRRVAEVAHCTALRCRHGEGRQVEVPRGERIRVRRIDVHPLPGVERLAGQVAARRHAVAVARHA